jgi:hypothetical protein
MVEPTVYLSGVVSSFSADYPILRTGRGITAIVR